MGLTWLEISRFRNISKAGIDLSQGLNLVSGPNGCGKTTLLESCHFLATGRSFRTTNLDPLVMRGEESCLVRGGISQEGRLYDVGIQRSRAGERQLRINGEKIVRASELAQLLPTLVLGPESVSLLVGPPAERRSFLNWGLFHVEHSLSLSLSNGFSQVWERANRCLRQRNQILRQDKPNTRLLETWTEQLAQASNEIDRYRQNYIRQYLGYFESAVKHLSELDSVAFHYRRGWDSERQLEEILSDDVEVDQKRGFTQKGFHRADVRITVDGQPAARVCSRGELKALVWAMILAQGQLVNSRDHRQALYLVDDLASEFDVSHRQRVCQYLAASDAQVILTGVEENSLIEACEGKYGQMFHVKHGEIGVQEN